ILKSASPRHVQAGEFYFFQDDSIEYLYLLITGRVKLTQNDSNGEQVIMQIIGPYTLFGAVALTDLKSYPVCAMAAEDCLALIWHRDSLKEFIKQYPTLALNGMQLLAHHAQEVQERFKQLATQRVERRLASTLLRLANQTGRKTDEGVLIDMPITRQDLAEMSGTTLFTVSRLLKQWEEQQLVLSRREKVIICYPHGLVCIAEDI
ncbi:MAG: Crp/Fnr family transcriptional regulator, partial [Anaerolineae bacterium]|nr:Crp/Fnr family transcriptional regulator [Anaerolineae bacterium]